VDRIAGLRALCDEKGWRIFKTGIENEYTIVVGEHYIFVRLSPNDKFQTIWAYTMIALPTFKPLLDAVNSRHPEFSIFWNCNGARLSLSTTFGVHIDDLARAVEVVFFELELLEKTLKGLTQVVEKAYGQPEN
jgi:hypothetical protein